MSDCICRTCAYHKCEQEKLAQRVGIKAQEHSIQHLAEQLEDALKRIRTQDNQVDSDNEIARLREVVSLQGRTIGSLSALVLRLKGSS